MRLLRMKKLLLTLAACALLLTPALSMAAETDMAALKCSDVLKSKQDEKVMLVLWVDGYMSGSSDVTTINGKWIEQLTGHIMQYCGKNAGKTIMDAANAMPETSVEGGDDVMKMDCKSFLAESQENIGLTIMWVDGYMSAKSENTKLADEWIQKLSTHLGTYCGKNPAKTLGDAIAAMK